METQPNQLLSTPSAISEAELSPAIAPGSMNAVPAAKPRLLLVDDTESVRSTLQKVLAKNGFEVATANDVNTALKLIASQTFDVLLSDLHMPQAGDGLTVVSAMRNANPDAVTLILSGFPAMKKAASAILEQADAILIKPIAPKDLIDIIRERLNKGTPKTKTIYSVAAILEADTQATIADWLVRIDAEPELISVRLSDQDRSSHLPQLFHDLVARLQEPLNLGNRCAPSPSAAGHGLLRRKQGYTAAMLVEESRMLQVSIFQTLQNNLNQVEFSQVLVGVMAIADEVDSQLAQAMASYVLESNHDVLPVIA